MQITVEVPDELMLQLERSGHPVKVVIVQAIKSYMQSEFKTFSLLETQTWKLCGGLQVSKISQKIVANDNENDLTPTNYAQSVDDLLYGSMG